MADKVKTIKTFIVRKTYEFTVEAFTRDEAIQIVEGKDIAEGIESEIKCGTPKQMKREAK